MAYYAQSVAMQLVYLYGDGSCYKGLGGWGTILRQAWDGYEKEFSGFATDTTNNRMELTAVIEGLRALKEPCEVLVTSDSQYVVNAFNERWIVRWHNNHWLNGDRPLINWDLWQILWDLSYLHQLRFQWVRGHEGHPENERCDKLALDARKKLEQIARSVMPEAAS